MDRKELIKEIKYFFRFIPDSMYIKIYYRMKFRKKLNLNEPKTFNEKIQWLKLNNKNIVYNKMVDKYEVREYIKDKIGEEYLIPLLGAYEKVEDIDFETLPNQFVIKCTHDSGGLVICRDKTQLDIKSVKKKINKSLRRNYYYYSREWPYKDVKPRIIIEKYMEDKKSKELLDYKFFCFNGQPMFIYISEGLENHKTAKISFLDMNFKKEKFKRTDYREFESLPSKPVNFEKMKEISKKLSKGHPFLRVDLYEINNKIYFGELTFSPCGGYIPIDPIEYDEKIGKMLKIETK